MSSMRLLSAAALAASMALSTVVLAHHGWGGYDADNTLTLTGTIEASSYTNPHGSATVKTDAKTWEVVLAPPSRMQTRGLTSEMLAPGTRVTIVGYPHRAAAAELRAERITVDGKTIELR